MKKKNYNNLWLLLFILAIIDLIFIIWAPAIDLIILGIVIAIGLKVVQVVLEKVGN